MNNLDGSILVVIRLNGEEVSSLACGLSRDCTYLRPQLPEVVFHWLDVLCWTAKIAVAFCGTPLCHGNVFGARRVIGAFADEGVMIDTGMVRAKMLRGNWNHAMRDWFGEEKLRQRG